MDAGNICVLCLGHLMREESLPPFAPAMLDSMRAIGYSFEAAVADIVDNSIAAGAGRVDIQFRPTPSPYLAVIDDGEGMTGEALIQAMRHGGFGPHQPGPSATSDDSAWD